MELGNANVVTFDRKHPCRASPESANGLHASS
jgi:hypothetical protein